MKITILDKISFTVGDINLSPLDNLGSVEYYDVLSPSEVKKVLKDTDIVVCNKTVFDKDMISSLPKLKYIGLTATGYNNVDIAYAKERGITVCNVPNYSTVDVAQHVFAFILHYANKISEYDNSVKDGDWLKSKTFCYFDKPIVELYNKTLGIVGFGNIGKKVADIASAFGMKVLVYSRTKKQSEYEFCTKEELFKRSDFISLHCPLSEETSRLINKDTLSLMKPTAVIINTSRGGVIDEYALKEALEQGKIKHALLDVLTIEPMNESCPLIGVKNVTFTPHVAWAPVECRERLIKIVAENITAFINGNAQNVVNK
ncbi:MAG: D-2-hydroxyacid dehydrogenase [Clostridia bacterium]|nr:D-2-hydroxyacid dehydrogenase [Clostridia bacterium]